MTGSIATSDAVNRAAFLQSHLTKLAHSYYVLDEPQVSDGEYDLLFRELQKIESNHPDLMAIDSPTQRVGGSPVKELGVVRHSAPMLSIDNAMTESDALRFAASVADELGCSQEDVAYCAEPKYDGLSADLRYVDGILIQAATRGDSEEGENVTQQVRTIKNIPLRLPVPVTVNIRGEILMSKASFESVNAVLSAAGKKLLVNCRNGAAGSVRQLNPKITASRKLAFYGYGIVADDANILPDTQSGVLDLLRSWGFTVSAEQTVVKGFAGIKEFFGEISQKRASLPFDIDGIVFKIDAFADQSAMGWNHRVPRWAVAYKFPPEEMPTVLEAIDIQIGRLGTVTPVARLKPVFVGGVTVTNATLHNLDQIRLKDVRIGDTVIVRRAGDVIPEVVGPILDRRPENAQVFQMPSACPDCGSPLHQVPGMVDYICTGGMVCGAQRLYRLAHFGSRLCMNIDGLGESTVDALLNAKLIRLPSDFYSLQIADVEGLDGFGYQSAINLVRAIEQSKAPKLNRFIFSLGIEGVGEKTAKDLAKAFGTWNALSTAKEADFLAVDGIGPTTATSLLEFFADEVRGAEAHLLAQIIKPQAAEKTGTSFAGKTFVLTGTMPTLSREQATVLIERAGGKVAGSVSKKTFAVVFGEAAGTKLEKAKEIGVATWTEAELMAAIGDGGEVSGDVIESPVITNTEVTIGQNSLF